MATKMKKKITLSASRDIPFDKLRLSQANVRQVKAGVSIEELAEDIARRTLLASLTVRPVLAEDGSETGLFEIPAGGRRYRALELLVKQRRLNKTAPVPCIVRTDGMAEEDSLAENVQRAPLHPLDQFRAFQAMRDKGRSEAEIAAAFFVSEGVVKQRLKLAAVSPALLDVYAEDGMSLDQLMAFTIHPDHTRQAQVWEALQRHYSKEPHTIRRMLTEETVRASDRRARFVGLDVYVEAGGSILRDLFQTDHGGWLQDAALLETMVAEKLREESEAIRAEGWRWVEVATEFPYGHTYDLRRLRGDVEPMSEEEEQRYDALQTELAVLEDAHAEADDIPEEVETRLIEIEREMAALRDRPVRFDPEEVAIAGAFVSVDVDGRLRVERGYVRPEDEPPVEGEEAPEGSDAADAGDREDADVDGATSGDAPDDADEDDRDASKPLSDRLLCELTAHRTLALRDVLADDPHLARLAALHAMVLRLFYQSGQDSCVDLTPHTSAFGAQAPGLGDTAYAQSVDRRIESWTGALPNRAEHAWDALADWDADSRDALFAFCVSMTVNAVHDPYYRRPRQIAHGDVLATALGLDMAGAGWTATADSYLGRVTKARIVAAVREAVGDREADRIAGFKKPEMVEAAEALLAGTGWLPEPLRTPVRQQYVPAGDEVEIGEAAAVSNGDADVTTSDIANDLGSVKEPAADGGEPAVDPNVTDGEDEDAPTELVRAAE